MSAARRAKEKHENKCDKGLKCCEFHFVDFLALDLSCTADASCINHAVRYLSIFLICRLFLDRRHLGIFVIPDVANFTSAVVIWKPDKHSFFSCLGGQ